LELAEKIREQAEKFGAVIQIPENVVELRLNGKEKRVRTDREDYSTKAVIIATGCTCRKLDVPGEETFMGKGVSYCATCDGPLFRDKTVMVVGGGNTAVAEALYLMEIANKVYLTHRRDDLRADAILKERILRSDVEILWNSEVKSIEGDTLIRQIRMLNNETGEERIVPVDGIFIGIGEVPENDIAKRADVDVDNEGFIVVNKNQETNMKGVYAAGDAAETVRQIGAAAGSGIKAAVNAYLYVRGGWYKE